MKVFDKSVDFLEEMNMSRTEGRRWFKFQNLGYKQSDRKEGREEWKEGRRENKNKSLTCPPTKLFTNVTYIYWLSCREKKNTHTTKKTNIGLWRMASIGMSLLIPQISILFLEKIINRIVNLKWMAGDLEHSLTLKSWPRDHGQKLHQGAC